MSGRPMRLKMEDDDGSVYWWTCWRDKVLGYWMLQDHDGYVRNLEANWINSVPRIRLHADNYGFATTVS